MKKDILKEEFEKEIFVKNLFMSHVHTYENKGDFKLNAFWATCKTDDLPALHEHNDAQWVSLDNLNNFEFCPADIPFINELKKLERAKKQALQHYLSHGNKKPKFYIVQDENTKGL